MRRTAPYIFLILAIVLAYGNAITFDFIAVTDDEGNILKHHHDWIRILTEPYDGLYIPLPYLVWNFLWMITHEPWIFHLTSLLVHSLNSCLVYRILKDQRAPDPWPLLGAFVFAVHPAQTEPVVWISGLRDLLAGTCVFGGILAVTRGRLVIYPALVILGMVAKPVVIILPLLVLYGSRKRGEVVSSLVAIAVSMIPLIVSVASQGAKTVPNYPLWHRAEVAVDAVGYYINLVALPRWLNPSPERILPTLWCLVCGSVFLVYTLWKRRTWQITFISFLVPVLGLIPFSYQNWSNVSDRYLYIPMFGIAVFVTQVGRPEVHRKLKAGIVIAVICMFGLGSRQYSKHWTDVLTLYRYALNEEVRVIEGYKRHSLQVLGLYFTRTGNLETASALFSLAKMKHNKIEEGLQALGIKKATGGESDRDSLE